MKKIFKFGCLPILGLLVILFIIGLFIDTPEEKETLQHIKEHTPTIRETEAPEKAITQAKPREPTPARKPPVEITPIKKPPVEPIEVIWDKTPPAQGLKVGDWISIIGHQDAFISAIGTGRNGVFTNWNWIKQDTFRIDLVSNASAVSLSTDRIGEVSGRLESPLQNPTAKSANNRLMKQETVVLRLTGQIHQIMPPHEKDTYPNQWDISLESGVIIELIE